jgi:hypothetical protein
MRNILLARITGMDIRRRVRRGMKRRHPWIWIPRSRRLRGQVEGEVDRLLVA